MPETQFAGRLAASQAKAEFAVALAQNVKRRLLQSSEPQLALDANNFVLMFLVVMEEAELLRARGL